mgnify:CR=1 FL=1
MQTQWVRDGMGNLQGLNYSGVEVVIDIFAAPKKKARKQLFSEIQAMETATLDAIATKKK